jgi:hypothetical protein
MLHAYVERFDVMGGRGNILGWDGEVNKAMLYFYFTTYIMLFARSPTTAVQHPSISPIEVC